MALEGADAVLFQLKDKETKEDIDYENIQKESNENHVPMTTRREIISWYITSINIFLCFNTLTI